ncbi:zinc finger HIT domain-containing protein 1 [Haematobia irritans]|uniref:zinc finger HIT domain-containing protein 1 n=1 Tax=Haematobia irritans TaxID=7368 RepID=UPI003F50B617
MTGRESNRIKDAEKKRVLDEAARQRRARKALEALEQDNFHDDPHADLVMSKKVPKFQDNLKNPKENRKSKRKGPEYYRAKYRKNFVQLLDEEKQFNPDPPNYMSALAPPPSKPPRHFCAVCGNFSKYTCTACGTRYCCIRCLGTHQDTRCLKWTA